MSAGLFKFGVLMSPGVKAEDAGAKQREDMLQLRCYGCSMDFRRDILRREPSTSLMVAFPSKEMDTLIESCTHGRHGMQPCTAFLWKVRTRDRTAIEKKAEG